MTVGRAPHSVVETAGTHNHRPELQQQRITESQDFPADSVTLTVGDGLSTVRGYGNPALP